MPTKQQINTSWYKAGPSSQQAHLVTKAGSSLLVTACQVALNKAQAVPANGATQRCFECHNQEQSNANTGN